MKLRFLLILLFVAILVVPSSIGCHSTGSNSVIGDMGGGNMDPVAAPPPIPTEEWICPMHGNYVLPRPGQCGICGMALVHSSEWSETMRKPLGLDQRPSSSPRSSLSTGAGNGSCH